MGEELFAAIATVKRPNNPSMRMRKKECVDVASEVSEEVAETTIREQQRGSLPPGWKVLTQIHHKNVQKIAS